MSLLDLKFLEIYDLYLRYYLNLALVYNKTCDKPEKS